MNGEEHNATAGKEVLLSAGATTSPHLLELSGVGDSKILKSHGISIVHDLPAVGEDLQDHLQTRLQFECTEPVTANDIVRSNWHAARALLRFIFHRDGIFSTPTFKTQAFVPLPAGRGLPGSSDPVRAVQRHLPLCPGP